VLFTRCDKSGKKRQIRGAGRLRVFGHDAAAFFLVGCDGRHIAKLVVQPDKSGDSVWLEFPPLSAYDLETYFEFKSLDSFTTVSGAVVERCVCFVCWRLGLG